METHFLPAGRVHGGPVGWLKAALAIRKGRIQAIDLIRDFDPAVVVGFGGYPSLPSLLAAGATRRPRVLHEQNAVIGRATRLMAPPRAAESGRAAGWERVWPIVVKSGGAGN